jgi:hypothetical protein
MFHIGQKAYTAIPNGGFEPERSVKNAKAQALTNRSGAGRAGSAEAGWRSLAGCKRAEAESPLLRKMTRL